MTADEPDKFKRYAQIEASGTEVFYSMSTPLLLRMLSRARAGRRETDDMRESPSPTAKQFLLRDLVADMASGKSILVLMHSQYRVGPPRSPQMKN